MLPDKFTDEYQFRR